MNAHFKCNLQLIKSISSSEQKVSCYSKNAHSMGSIFVISLSHRLIFCLCVMVWLFLLLIFCSKDVSFNERRTRIDPISDWQNGFPSTWMYLFKHTKHTPFVKPCRFGQFEIRSIRCLPSREPNDPPCGTIPEFANESKFDSRFLLDYSSRRRWPNGLYLFISINLGSCFGPLQVTSKC